MDYESDDLSVGGLNLYTPYNAVAAYGTKDVYFQAGLQRNSFGSMVDTGIVLGATAPHVGSLVFTINKEKFNYQMAMLLLSASNSKGEGSYPSKYFYLHSLRYSFTEKFDFTVYETAITGPRFDFTYLMPIVPFMAMQQISGYENDNLLLGVEFSLCEAWGKGGEGSKGLAQKVVELCESSKSEFKYLYSDELPLKEKIETIAKEIYRAKNVDFSSTALKKLAQFTEEGFGNLPVCIAKTQNSISHDPKLVCAPKDYSFPVRDVQLYSGAGFVVVLSGDIMTMPGLPKVPAANNMDVIDGKTVGLF